MPAYHPLHRHSEEGAQTIRQLPGRVEQATQLARSMDCGVECCPVDGRYDSAAAIGAPGERTAKQLALGVTSSGTVTTEFQRAFHESGIEELVEGIPEP